MTLDEAIKHAEEVAEEKENEAQDLEYSKLDWKYEANQCSKCSEEHRQLAEWLKELKDYRERIPSYEAGYNDAKREIALSGEYQRAYERGKKDAEQTRWIPVSERVPQECIHTYDNNFHDYTRSESVSVTIKNEVTNSVYVFRDLAYISNGEWYIDNCYDHDRFKNCSVIAWMPRPKPYEPQERGDTDE